MPPHGGLYVVTAAPPAVRTPADLAAIAGPADLMELRLDLFEAEDPDFDAAAWIAAAPRPVLATMRSRGQGGAFTGSPRQAAARLAAAVRAGARWIDVEARVAPCLADLPPDAFPEGVRRVASEHGLPPPDEVPALPPGFDLLKLARPVIDTPAFLHLLGESAQLGAGGFVVPYGSLAATRTLFAGRDRSALLFGSARADAPAAPGQPTLVELLEELRAGEVSTRAALYGLVGDPPGRSPSPAMHNAVFRARDVDALYVPLPGLALEEAVGLPVEGLSVTHPYKGDAYVLADVLDPTARAVGAVNTLVKRADGWWGGNTDATAIRSLVPDAEPGAHACVLGAGGYACAAVWALKERGYEVRVVARHEPRGATMAEASGVTYAGTFYERADDDAVLVNATPAGADGEPVEALAEASLAGLLVLDAPYRNAGQTGCVAQAEAQGARQVIDGRTLLHAQACDQARAFGAGDDVGVDAVCAAALELPPTLILLGTRGAGKTTIGRAVARQLGRPFVDLDAEVLRVTGRTAAAWIEEDGWDAFRRLEGELLERSLARRGIVLATGGGVVEGEANRALLAACGVRVHLDLAPAEAARRVASSTTERPRIPGATDLEDEARQLVARRSPHWEALAHHVVDASGAVETVVAEVARCWCEHRPAG